MVGPLDHTWVYANEVSAVNPYIVSGWWVIMLERPTMWLEYWGFEPHDIGPTFRSGGKLEIEFNHMANDWVNDSYIMKPQWKLCIPRLSSASGLVNTSVSQESGASWFHGGRHENVPVRTLPDHALWIFPFGWPRELYPLWLNFNHMYSTLFKSVSHSE